MAKIIGIKFRGFGKTYYFAPGSTEFKKGDGAIVETSRGVEYATVVIPNKEVSDEEIVQPLKPVLRKATEKDEEKNRKNLDRIPEAKKIAAELIAKHGLKMKLVDAEFTFDGTKVVFYFTAPTRIDFRELVKDLASNFHIRIELRQVGIRDEAKILGGIAPCGRECCCRGCMPEFQKVSIKMAKTQGLSLNPSKISGLCGRLMCCLAYENDYYSCMYKKMPKNGSVVQTPDGEGVVVSSNMLSLTVRTKIDRGEGGLVYKDFPLQDVKFLRSGRPTGEEKLTAEEAAELKNLEE